VVNFIINHISLTVYRKQCFVHSICHCDRRQQHLAQISWHPVLSNSDIVVWYVNYAIVFSAPGNRQVVTLKYRQLSGI